MVYNYSLFCKSILIYALDLKGKSLVLEISDWRLDDL